MFFLKDETGHPILTWKYAESHIMWGMICLFASGLALGRLVIETGAIEQLATLIAAMHLSGSESYPLHPWQHRRRKLRLRPSDLHPRHPHRSRTRCC